MPIGFLYKPSTYAVPDRQLSKAATRKTLVANFGDGYEQRIADGINSVKLKFSLTFNTRTIEEIDEIASYLESVLAVESFSYSFKDTTVAGDVKTVRVVCDSYNVTYNNDMFASLKADFRQVFDLD